MLKNEITRTLKDNLVFPDSKRLQQRGIADKIEDLCNDILTNNFSDVIPARSRRSIEDITVNGAYVDHKTSDEALKFKMPNLISVDRLMNLDKDLLYNFVIYNSKTKKIVDNFTLNVYELNWNHLKIQNLGAGQLQISNMSEFLKTPNSKMCKEEWIQTLRQQVIDFYDRLIVKTETRKKKWKQSIDS